MSARPGPVFRLEIVAAQPDIDGLGHVSNLAYVRWVQDVAVAHSAAVGWDLGAYRELGSVFVVRRHEVDYLRPALEGDRVRLETWVDKWGAATCERHTSIVRASDEVELARAKTTWALVGVETARPCRIPTSLRGSFIASENLG